MDPAPHVYDMSSGSGSPTGPPFDALDDLILEMLGDEQWTTGSIISCANKLARRGALDIEDDSDREFEEESDPEPEESTALHDIYEELREDNEVDDDGPIQRHDVYDELRILVRIGDIEHAHPPTSMYRLVDPDVDGDDPQED